MQAPPLQMFQFARVREFTMVRQLTSHSRTSFGRLVRRRNTSRLSCISRSSSALTTLTVNRPFRIVHTEHVDMGALLGSFVDGDAYRRCPKPGSEPSRDTGHIERPSVHPAIDSCGDEASAAMCSLIPRQA